MPTVHPPYFFARILLKRFQHRNSQPRRRPHVRHIQILPPIGIEIEPADAHSRPNIFNARFVRHVRERPIAAVLVKILRPKSFTTYKSGQPSPLKSPHPQQKLNRELFLSSPVSRVTSRKLPSRWFRIRKFGGPFSAA